MDLSATGSVRETFTRDEKFNQMLDSYATKTEKTASVVSTLKPCMESLLASNPLLKPFSATATIVLHGSTVHSIHDGFSDLDCWLVLNEDEEATFFLQ